MASPTATTGVTGTATTDENGNYQFFNVKIGAYQVTAERDGFAAFFPKPCLPHELAAGLRQVLDGYRHTER